ncbi:MAG: DNA polymerase, partial [Bacteroidetes bacterium]|nr:DNA polymerase [Bacteroidota bacterium]
HIYNYLQRYIEKTIVELPVLTKGVVTTPGQIARIVKWCCDNGHYMPNLQAETLELELCRPSLPANIRRILELRQELGRSSTAKYKKILAQALKLLGKPGYWVYDNLRYHGAGTGRWTGMGFQMHNLPRLGVKDLLARDVPDDEHIDPQPFIDMFNGVYCGTSEDVNSCMNEAGIINPVKVAKALIRPMIKAPKGYVIVVADYTSIENMILAWAADDFQTLEDFRNCVDQYKTMASARFGVAYDEVTKEQRRVGKVIILGCGFGMGWAKFKTTALTQAKLELSDAEAQASVNAYRDKYSLVKLLWRNLHRTAVEAVISGQKRRYKNTTFGTFVRNGVKWLAMLLPTGKALYYCEPTVKQELIKDYEFMGPVPTITHWGVNPYSKKWSRLKLIPGRITENFVQASAREVMAQGMLRVKKQMPFIKAIGSVHDEALGLIKETDATPENLKLYCETLSAADFLPGCPIKAAGFYTTRYKKE